MALAIDVNVSNYQAANIVTSPSFSTTSANELLLAFISADSTPTSVTVTGAGLTWVQIGSVQVGTITQVVYIWRAFASTTLSAQSVTATSSSGLSDMGINIVSFSGVNTSGTNGSGAIGATGSAQDTAGNGALSTSITTTVNNSWVWAVSGDNDNNSIYTAGTNQTINYQFADAGDLDAFAVIKQNATTPTSGTSVTMNYTVSGAGDRTGIFVVEVLPATAGGGAQFNSFLTTLGVT